MSGNNFDGLFDPEVIYSVGIEEFIEEDGVFLAMPTIADAVWDPTLESIRDEETAYSIFDNSDLQATWLRIRLAEKNVEIDPHLDRILVMTLSARLHGAEEREVLASKVYWPTGPERRLLDSIILNHIPERLDSDPIPDPFLMDILWNERGW